jgi:hypothetical protein
MSKPGIEILEDSQIAIKDESSLDKVATLLSEQVESTKSIEIKDPWDSAFLAQVKKIKMGYVKNRNTIARVFKADRDFHTQHNRKNREVELKVLEIMEGEENRLTAEIDRAELERIKEERRKLIPFRKNELAKYEATATDCDLLALSDEDFEKFLTQKREEWTKKEEARIERERMLEEARKQAQKEKEEAIQREKEESERRVRKEKERAEREKKESEERMKEEKERAIQQERDRQEEQERKAKEREEKIRQEAEAEKQRILDEQREKEERERKRIEDERKAKEEAEKKAQEEREKAEKNKKFLKFLKDNNFDEKTMEWKKSGNYFEIWTLPKKVAEITI